MRTYLNFSIHRQTALASSVGISTILIPMSEPHHADVSLFCEYRSWQSDHSKSRSLILAELALFLFRKVMACKSAGSLYHKRICLLYSVFKEQQGLSAYQRPSKSICMRHKIIIAYLSFHTISGQQGAICCKNQGKFTKLDKRKDLPIKSASLL